MMSDVLPTVAFFSITSTSLTHTRISHHSALPRRQAYNRSVKSLFTIASVFADASDSLELLQGIVVGSSRLSHAVYLLALSGVVFGILPIEEYRANIYLYNDNTKGRSYDDIPIILIPRG